MDISIIITGHHEGILLHKTILSMLESASKLDKKTTYEFILNLDNPSKETLETANKWSDDPRFSIFTVNFGNPADNRNDAIKKAKGEYIALVDGDDLVSSKWLYSAYSMAIKEKEPTIFRPEIHMQFGYTEYNCTIWKMRSSTDKQTDAIQLAYWNLWTSLVFAKRDLLIENPYVPPVNGFGFEDYLFGVDTIAKGIKHQIVPETMLFYRRRQLSVTSFHINTILGYSDLFDINYFKNMDLPNNIESRSVKDKFKSKAHSTYKRGYRFVYDTSKKIKVINKLVAPIGKKILYEKRMREISPWTIQEWKKINKIENQLWPTNGEIAKLNYHPLTFNPFENRYGIIYKKLCDQLKSNKIDYLFLAPGMSGRGGTEKLIANYIKAIKKAHPKWDIAILSTIPFNSATKEYFINLDVSLVDFGRLTRNVGDYEKNIIWSRLLVQSKVKKIHLLNDEYWYRWMSTHQDLLIKNNYEINISLFMREFVHEKGRILTFADPHLVEIWPSVNKVFTDNKRVIKDALSNNAFEEDKFICHYQPEDYSDIVKPKLIDNSKKIRVLWASRISLQKRPDILKKISKKLGDDFEIDAYGIFEKNQFNESFFKGTKINYKGSFNGIPSINTSDYDIYLYTSQTDGVPNILMEISKTGLPIVASNAGGISEFIHDHETGLLIDIEDINGYVKALNYMKDNPKKAKQMADNSQKLLKSQHSWDRFEKEVKKDI